jgi:hypothetical protein
MANLETALMFPMRRPSASVDFETGVGHRREVYQMRKDGRRAPVASRDGQRRVIRTTSRMIGDADDEAGDEAVLAAGR